MLTSDLPEGVESWLAVGGGSAETEDAVRSSLALVSGVTVRSGGIQRQSRSVLSVREDGEEFALGVLYGTGTLDLSLFYRGLQIPGLKGGRFVLDMRKLAPVLYESCLLEDGSLFVVRSWIGRSGEAYKRVYVQRVLDGNRIQFCKEVNLEFTPDCLFCRVKKASCKCAPALRNRSLVDTRSFMANLKTKGWQNSAWSFFSDWVAPNTCGRGVLRLRDSEDKLFCEELPYKYYFVAPSNKNRAAPLEAWKFSKFPYPIYSPRQELVHHSKERGMLFPEDTLELLSSDAESHEPLPVDLASTLDWPVNAFTTGTGSLSVVTSLRNLSDVGRRGSREVLSIDSVAEDPFALVEQEAMSFPSTTGSLGLLSAAGLQREPGRIEVLDTEHVAAEQCGKDPSDHNLQETLPSKNDLEVGEGTTNSQGRDDLLQKDVESSATHDVADTARPGNDALAQVTGKSDNRSRCGQCNVTYVSPSALRRHLRTVHKKLWKFVCDCGKRFYHRSDFDRHRRGKNHAKVLKTRVMERLAEHSAEANDDDQRPFIPAQNCA